MAMVLRNKLSYHHRLFLLLLVFSWVLMACFVTFHYIREKQYKAEKLNSSLQLINKRIVDAMTDNISPELVIPENSVPYKDLRISVIDKDGHLIYDNNLDTLPETNHLTRPEIKDAIKYGMGYTVRRHSSSTDINYFYSAMKDGNVIVRTAVPYSVSLQEILEADNGFLWFMLAVTSILSLMGYFATRKLGQSIQRLNSFAKDAEKGERILPDESFPHDELGEISHHIIRLYSKLQKTTEDLHKEHERSLHEEQEKIRIKKQLTNNINHELKTPVASIKACLETLLEHEDLPLEKRREFLSHCYTNSERLCQLLGDVATITRMDEGAQMIEKEDVDINDLINEIIDDYTPRLTEATINVHVNIHPRITVKANYSLLTSIFRNLLDNAIAYSGGHNIDIRLLDIDNGLCYFSFADDGIGVDEQHLPHLFERFYRVDKGRSRKLGGTGLGLAIVKNAVTINGGTITVNNVKGGGLEFMFSLVIA